MTPTMRLPPHTAHGCILQSGQVPEENGEKRERVGMHAKMNVIPTKVTGPHKRLYSNQERRVHEVEQIHPSRSAEMCGWLWKCRGGRSMGSNEKPKIL